MPESKEAAVEQGDFLSLAQALGKQIDLSMILPVADPAMVLQNVTLTGLNAVDLPALEPASPKNPIQPFAEGSHIRQDIPLYGAAAHPAEVYPTGQAVERGQAASAGLLKHSPGQKGVSTTSSKDFFDQQVAGLPGLADQVIQYARWATRLGAHQSFDVIYAYDWRTFLAGTELKLVSDKPLVLQVDSLSVQHPEVHQHGWMYQVEAQALHKADCIITPTDDLAVVLQKEYQIPAGLISSLEEKNQGWPSETSLPQRLSPAASLPQAAAKRPQPVQAVLEARSAAESPVGKKASRISGILMEVAA
ncbi:MAG: glycosyltransferase family 4 protein [Adhaeribacter sp.]